MMKKYHCLKRFSIISLFLFYTFNSKAGINHLLPKPQKLIEYTDETTIKLKNVNLITSYHLNNYTDWLINDCGTTITSNAGDLTLVTINLSNSIEGADPVDEVYAIDIKTGNVTISAASEKAVYWALQTLKQLTDGDKGNVTLPACKIVDWPAFRIRGYMHDSGRSYIEFDELKKQIALLSRYKINVFHWHLTENQGWRLESKLYPQLNAVTNYTRHPEKYYTIEQAKELVEWSKQHGVTLIPEIDIPGHSEAFARAFGYNMQSTQGIATLKNLMTEICEVFAGTEWMHIGTDEVQDCDARICT